MKTSFRMLVVMLVIACAMLSATANPPMLSAKEKAKIEKEVLKEAKKTSKELKKEGWKIEQTGQMESVIARHMMKVKTEGLEELIGTAFGKKNLSICRKIILSNVSLEYATKLRQVIKGGMANKDNLADGAETEDKVGNYESRIATEIAGELLESYSVYRRNSNGSFDMEIHYLISPDRARAAKKHAELEYEKEFRKSVHDAVEGN